MHPLLKNQLEFVGLQEGVAPDDVLWKTFLDRVSLAYMQADNDRHILEQTARNSRHSYADAAASTSTQAAANEIHQGKPNQYPMSLALLDSSPDTALLFDRQLEIVASSNIASLIEPALRERLTQFGALELAGALGVDVYARLKIAVQSVFDSQRPKRLLFDLYQPGGSLTYEARVLPVAEKQGNVVAVYIRDWSAVTRATRSAQMYKDLFDAASEGMMLLDSQQRVVLVNRSYEQMSEQTAEQLQTLDSPRFLNAQGESLDTEIWSHVFYHDTWSGEACFAHSSGLKVPVWVTIDALKDQEGHNINFLVLCSDISQLNETQEKLAYLANHDQLTGLPNRAYFQDHLSGAIARSDRAGSCGALFFMDLDNFKSINDTLGHPVGDALLLEMARRLKQFVREGELVSRIGGDEFTLVVENLDSAEDAAVVAQRVLKEFEAPFECDGQQLDMGCSIGISVFPIDGSDRDQIIRQADTAMYSAKQAGRNTFKFYTSQLTHKAVQNFNVESQLRRAIERDELFLNYQPQVDMKRNTLLGAEVLVRWNNEQYGYVSPAEFIPIAEASGQIEEIGEWVLDRTCLQMSHWRHYSEIPCLVSVNVSRKQLVRTDFCKRIADILDRYSLRGDQLEIEVTESAIASSESIAIRNLNGLRELGCKIAIDDFGTGYSSLSSLKKFPLDRLKIDRSFVQDLGQDPNADAIIAAIIAMSKTLGLGVIAEGVETQQQVKALLKRGCREAQGYFYSKPLLASDFREFVLKTAKA